MSELAAAAMAAKLMNADAQNVFGNKPAAPGTSGQFGRAQNAFTSGGISEFARFTGLGGNIMGGKSGDQQGRDLSRKALQSAGLYDKDFNLALSDGTKVNMGLDGSVKNYNIDFSQEGIGNIVADVNPLAYLVANGDKKRASDLAGEFTNAIRQAKDPRAEAKRLYEQLGITKAQAADAFTKMGLDDGTKNVFLGTFDSLGIQDPQQGNSDEIARVQASSRAFIDRMNSASRQSAEDAKKAQQTSNRSAIINNLLSKASTAGQNINYPKPQTGGFLSRVATPGSQPQQAQFSGTLNKILGG